MRDVMHVLCTRHKKQPWHKRLSAYWNRVPYNWRPGQIWYRFKCWAWYRYTTVKPRYLPHTWTDRDDVLPHVMFEVLSQFIERECTPECIDWEASGHMITVDGVEKNVRQEMQELYDWWHQEYNKDYPKCAVATPWQLPAMMHRLVNVTPYLWT